MALAKWIAASGDENAKRTELNNVCACARLKRRNLILSFLRDDFLFCSFVVLVSLVSAKIWT